MSDTPESAREKYLKALEEKKKLAAEEDAKKHSSSKLVGSSIKQAAHSVAQELKPKAPDDTSEEEIQVSTQKQRRSSVLKTLGDVKSSVGASVSGVMSKAKDFIPSKAKKAAETPTKTPMAEEEIERRIKDQLIVQIAYCIKQYQTLISGMGGGAAARMERKGLKIASKEARDLGDKEYATIAEEFKTQFNASRLHPFHEVDGFIATMMEVVARNSPIYEDTFTSVFNFDEEMNDRVLALAGGIIDQLHVKEQRVEVKPPPLPRKRPDLKKTTQTPLMDMKKEKPPLPPRDTPRRDEEQTGDGRPKTKHGMKKKSSDEDSLV